MATKKYGRTFHLPISPGATSDDKIMTTLLHLSQSELVITEKMDGECTTIHSGGTHARSPDGRHHPSRDWVKAFSAGISPNLGSNERIVGENLFARHSLHYDKLPTYFMGFALIIDDVFQSWDATLHRFDELGITPVPTLYRGPYSEGMFEALAKSLDLSTQEGFVARSTQSFPESSMSQYMGKYVRSGHVQTDTHWMHTQVIPNGLA